MLLQPEQSHNLRTLSDNRPGTLAQMKVVEAMSQRGLAQKTAQLQALMPDNSPLQKATDRGRSANESQTQSKKLQDEEEGTNEGCTRSEKRK